MTDLPTAEQLEQLLHLASDPEGDDSGWSVEVRALVRALVLLARAHVAACEEAGLFPAEQIPEWAKVRLPGEGE